MKVICATERVQHAAEGLRVLVWNVGGLGVNHGVILACTVASLLVASVLQVVSERAGQRKHREKVQSGSPNQISDLKTTQLAETPWRSFKGQQQLVCFPTRGRQLHRPLIVAVSEVSIRPVVEQQWHLICAVLSDSRMQRAVAPSAHTYICS